MNTVNLLGRSYADQTSSSNSTSDNSSSTSSTSTTTFGKNEFLQLLVAQLQNQDPMNPMDDSQFVTQLASFSSLEQLISINQAVSKLAGTDSSTSSSSTTTT